MESFTALEQKIIQLLSLIKSLKEENVQLAASNHTLIQENADLVKRIEQLENSVLKGTALVEEEKALTKMVVDDLIKSIDSLVGNESPS